ncbi:hypothetical protein [Mesorhizobium sp. IMUNJ 23232]|uniref:hypothetical protein n=1 Tax=Mesorhizobium sp. IMUNJ 23232 TaxID=3376064 RepID=UPI0037AA77E7
MGYGFQLVSGDDNEAIDSALMDSITEVRVEEELSKATRFAVRFDEDLCEGEPKTLQATALKPGQMLGVIVWNSEEQPHCLVRGPITKTKSSAVVGGAGSWLEVHGEDRRLEMDRQTVHAAWEGLASDIVGALLTNHGFEPTTAATTRPFDKAQNTLNQSNSDLKLIEDLARKNNYEFWVTYEVSAPSLFQTGYEIIETAHFEPSPPRPAGLAAALPFTLDDLVGGASGPTIRIHTPVDKCPNTTSFEIDVDAERATAALIAAVNTRTGDVEETEAADEQPETDPGALRVADAFGVKRTISEPGAGTAEDRRAEQEAVLTEEGWFITAKVSTSSHLLPGILSSHQIVSVEGSGFLHAGKYQVAKVVHVINAWGHLMDATLRRNALPEALNA